MRTTFNKGVVVEVVGDDILILGSDHHTVHTLPLSYLDTVDALLQSREVPSAEQLAELELLGLVATAPGRPVSRRAMFVGAVAVGVTLAMPRAALASSETFFVGDDVFVWGDTYVRSVALQPQPASVFTPNSTWTLTVNGVSNSAQVKPDGTDFFGFPFESLPCETVLLGRLTGANGSLSNVFEIRRDGFCVP
jgi:hypothetical protein